MTLPGSKRALATFHRAAKEIPAYRDFLQARSFRATLVKSVIDFEKVPVMNKKEYFSHYPVHDLFADRKISPMVYASSGSSGKPTFWFRGNEEEIRGARAHARIFKDIFGISKRSDTLVVICFSMGIWVAGNYTLASCRILSDWGYALSTITPGIEMDDILYIIKNLAPHFDNVIFAGYPPFLMDVVSRAEREGISLPEHAKFITAGDKFTESWRDAFLGAIHAGDPYHSVVSVYGSADAGMLGHETPLTIAVRRAAWKDNEFRMALFGEGDPLPALVQYNPDSLYVESLNNELLFTTNSSTPLIRYNIRDIGDVVPWGVMMSLMKKYNIRLNLSRQDLSRWKLPFIIKKGRNDVAVTFYALNIYPENIKAGLNDEHIKKIVSGQFFGFTKNSDHNKYQKLCLNIELADGVAITAHKKKLIEKWLMRNLIASNTEYRKLYATIGNAALPRVTLFKRGDHRFHDRDQRGLLGLHGKKMRVFDPKA